MRLNEGKSMIINVTQEDIENGIRHSCFSCPIALAVKRETGCNCSVESANFHLKARIFMMGSYEAYFPGKEAEDFINNFDGGKPVKPFSFELDVDFPG